MATIENNQSHDIKNNSSLECGKNDPSLEYEKNVPSLEYVKSEKSDQGNTISLSDPPLGWASYSDVCETRRRVYLVSLAIYVVAGIICAISNNIWLLLVMRSLQACGGSSVHSIGAGTVSDVFINTERGRAYGWFYLGPLIGPILGPVIGGYITQYFGWRFIFWFLSLYGGIILVFIYFALPETFHRVQSSLPTASSPKKRFNPFSSLALLRYPNLTLTVFYISAVFSVIYILNTLIPRTFSSKFNLSTSNIGLVFLSPGLGYCLGSVASGCYSDFLLSKISARYGDIYPEVRINGVWLGSALVPVSLLAYGWSIVKNAHIIFPILSLFLFDAFPGRSASAIAVNNFFRYMASAITATISIPAEDMLGKKWRERFQY
ncbi:4234_t:CDS:2 [Cetraspora pellucida]|uniref:4234_t:CDS:1 n=1 Tax=Cetraspora pellucida TaxID=1433469 RepID=A0ACA9LDH7_9GLOM|nr:4234_t:CDS:2 [Cetraspora pellucida]